MADPTLKEVAHTASCDMFDVMALLLGLRSIFAAERREGELPDRLLRQAMERLENIQSTFDPHI